MPNGPVSNWLHDNLKPGVSVKALGPMGSFTCFAHPASKYLFLSGGSGITPFMSIMREVVEKGSPLRIHLLYGSREAGDIIFRKELAQLGSENDNIDVDFIISEPGVWGIGNGLLQDILLAAKIHPRCRAVDLTKAQRRALHRAIVNFPGQLHPFCFSAFHQACLQLSQFCFHLLALDNPP